MLFRAHIADDDPQYELFLAFSHGDAAHDLE